MELWASLTILISFAISPHRRFLIRSRMVNIPNCDTRACGPELKSGVAPVNSDLISITNPQTQVKRRNCLRQSVLCNTQNWQKAWSHNGYSNQSPGHRHNTHNCLRQSVLCNRQKSQIKVWYHTFKMRSQINHRGQTQLDVLSCAVSGWCHSQLRSHINHMYATTLRQWAATPRVKAS